MKKNSRGRSSNAYLLKFAVVSLIAIGVVAGTVALTQRLNTTDPRSQAAGVTDSFVTASGTKFYLGSQEFKFVGFNLFDAAGNSASPYSCLQTNGWWTKFSDAELDAALKTMKAETGSTVLRFWAFQKYTDNGTNFAGIDRIIQMAKINGFKVLPVLEDGPGYCTEPGGGGNAHIEKWKYNGDTWYTDGYKVPNAPYKLSYRDFVKTIVTRYKDEPTIMAWMLVNEADTSKKVQGSDGKMVSALVPFTNDMGTLVKSIDKNHLLTVGTQSNGASGATGQDFIDVYSIPSIDFAEGHDWGYWGNDNEAIPGGIKNADGSMSLPDPLSAECLKTYQAKIGCSMAQAKLIVKKPYVMGEIGIAADTTATRQNRAVLMDKKMKAFFDSMGSGGYLYWQWNKIVDQQKYDVLPNTNDPLLPVMKKYAGLAIPPLGATPSPSSGVGGPINSPSPVPSPRVTPTPVATVKPTPTPTLKPTSIPSPTLKPTPTPTPTARPASPTPRPSTTPTPAPVSRTIEGENMTVVSGTSTIVNDSAAAAGRALFMQTNSTVKATIMGPLSRLTVRARPVFCLGAPHINVKVNGSYVMDQNLDKAGYNDYVSNSFAYLKLGPGVYNVEVIYNNDASFFFCNRNLYLDRITAQ